MFDSTEKKHAEQFLSYLDDLAANDPKAYEQFIQKQMKEGLNAMAKDHKAQKEAMKSVEVKPALAFRFVAKSIVKQKQESIKIQEDINLTEVPKITFGYSLKNIPGGIRFLPEPRIYLNLVTSPEYPGPVDTEGNPAGPYEESKWSYIPTTFRFNGTKSSLSGEECEFYECLLNFELFERLKSDENIKKAVMSFIVRKFSMFLSDKYDLLMNYCKILTKRYKSVTKSPLLFKIDKDLKEAKQEPKAKEEKKIKFPVKSENIGEGKYEQIPVSSKKIEIKEVTDRKVLVRELEKGVSFDFSLFGDVKLEEIEAEASGSVVRVRHRLSDWVERDVGFVAENIQPRFNSENKTLLFK